MENEFWTNYFSLNVEKLNQKVEKLELLNYQKDNNTQLNTNNSSINININNNGNSLSKWIIKQENRNDKF